MRFKIGSTYTLGYGIGKVKIEKPTAKGKTFKAVRQSDGKSIHFGDPDMPTRQDNPKAKKNYCSRASSLAPRGFNPNTFSLIYWDCIPAKGTSTNSEDGMNKIRLYTNVGKAQIEETDSHFKITNIPITKNNSVMNGIAYFENDNKEGMPSMIDQPITLRHPEVNGANVSVKDGKGLNYWSGSLIESAPYVNSGKWFVDVQINKAKLAAHDDGERWTEILSNKEVFGVSTGLTFSANDESGELDGKHYRMRAKNQSYDHLAFLDPKVEAPAGGEDTMVYFNSKVNQGEVITCNVDDLFADELPAKDKGFVANILDGVAKLLANHGDFDSQEESGYNNHDLNNNRGNAMFTKEETIGFLANAGIEIAANASEEEVKLKFNEYMSGKKKDADTDKDEDDKKKEKKDKAMNAEEISAIVAEAVNAAVKPLKDELAANKEGELKGLREAVNKLDLGLPEVAVNAMGKEDLESLVNKHGGSFADYSGLNVNHRVNSGVKTESFDDVDLNAGAED